MGEAARLVDRLAHRYAGGRWLATGGGGYAIYRVVPRAWALTWLAATHREAPRLLPEEWRDRWAGEAARWGDHPLPLRFEDEADVPSDRAISVSSASAATRTAALVRTLTVPAFLLLAEERGWRTADGSDPASGVGGRASGDGVRTEAGHTDAGRTGAGGAATVVAPLTLEMLDRLRLAARSIAPADPSEGAASLRAALGGGGVAVGAVAGEWLVGVALAAPAALEGVDELAALGVAPEWRRLGLATALLRALAELQDRRGRALVALHTVAERDPFDPLPREVRRSVADRLFRSAGFRALPVPPALSAADPASTQAGHFPPGVGSEFLAAVERWSAAR
jgi:GNAT superfamily N-acetyltransferase